MAKKKAYPLRMDEDVLRAMQRLADDELRSLNAQIEYVCRRALRQAGRLPKRDVVDETALQPAIQIASQPAPDED